MASSSSPGGVSLQASEINNVQLQLEAQVTNLRLDNEEKDKALSAMRSQSSTLSEELQSLRQQLASIQSLPLQEPTSYQSTTTPGNSFVERQTKYDKLKELHADTNCEGFEKVCQQKVRDAEQRVLDAELLQAAAEADLEGVQHILPTFDAMETNTVMDQEALLSALEESRANAARADKFFEQYTAEKLQTTALQAELAKWKPVDEDLDYDMDAMLDGVIVSDTDSDSNKADHVTGLVIRNYASSNGSNVSDVQPKAPVYAMRNCASSGSVDEPQAPALTIRNAAWSDSSNSSVDLPKVPVLPVRERVPLVSSGSEDQTVSSKSTTQAPVLAVRNCSDVQSSTSPVPVFSQSASLALSSISTISVNLALQPAPDAVAANITIKLSRANTKQWSLMQRVQSAITASSKLDVQGPFDLVADFVKGLQHTSADHAHWQSVALNSLDELETLRARPTCVVPGHRHLLDKLAAKEVQLQMQASLVAHWQKESSTYGSPIQQAGLALQHKLGR